MNKCNEGPVLGVIATHLRPAEGFGGVVESTSSLIEYWRGEGRKLRIITSNGTLGPPLVRSDFECALLGEVDVYKIQRWTKWGFGVGFFIPIWRMLKECDAIYISGIGTWPTTVGAVMAAISRKRYFVALRGGLTKDHWLSIRSAKPAKALFYRSLTFPTLRQAAAVHVTSELEAREALEILPGIETLTVPNALTLPSDDNEFRTEINGDSLKLLFLGRLAPEKAILEFVRAIEPHLLPGDEVQIAGAPDGEYGSKVIKFCEGRPGFRYLGVLSRMAIQDILHSSNMLILPSGFAGADVRENFGNVVVEALSCGRPVLVSSGLAWDSIEEDGVGILLERSGASLARTLAAARALIVTDGIAAHCRAYALNRFSLPSVARRTWEGFFSGKPWS